jgi:outer membrane protein
VAGLYAKFDKANGVDNGMVYGTLSIPLSGWWEAGHAIKERKLRERAAVNSAGDNQQLLLLQMDKAWRDLIDAEKVAALSEETHQQAEENRRVTEDSYRSGIVTLTDLLEAEAALQQAADQLIEAKANYRMKQSVYLQETGR